MENSTWLDTHNWKTWGSDVSMSYFKMNGETYPFLEYQALAVFDPQVDYLYVNALEFGNLIIPALKAMYGDDIGCTKTECYFVRTCNEAKR